MTIRELDRLWNYKTIEIIGMKNKYITFYHMHPIYEGDLIRFEIDIRNIYNNQRLYKICKNISDVKRSVKQFILIQQNLEKSNKIEGD